jgi:hypothetical protein
VSDSTIIVSVRPCGKPAGPPKFRAPPATLICGKPIAEVTPPLMPRSAGFMTSFGEKVMLILLKPSRASFTRLGPKMWVSSMVPICRLPSRVSPKPGSVLPCRMGSPRRSFWKA